MFCGLLLGLAAYLSAERVVLGMVRARELPSREAPDLHAASSGCRAGRGRQAAAVPDREGAAAGALGRQGRELVGDRGDPRARAAASPAEIEAVLAHELAHIRRRDVLVQTTAVVLGTTIVEVSRIGGWLERALLFVLGPVASAFVHCCCR